MEKGFEPKTGETMKDKYNPPKETIIRMKA